MANTPFKLKSGNTTPFKEMGSFNIQDKKLNKYKHAKKWDLLKKYYKTHAKSLSKKATQALKKGGKFLSGKALGVAGMMMATSSKADQPVPPPVKPMDEKEKKSVQTAISQQMNPLKE